MNLFGRIFRSGADAAKETAAINEERLQDERRYLETLAASVLQTAAGLFVGGIGLAIALAEAELARLGLLIGALFAAWAALEAGGALLVDPTRPLKDVVQAQAREVQHAVVGLYLALGLTPALVAVLLLVEGRLF